MEQRSILILFFVLAGVAVIVFSFIYSSSRKAGQSAPGMSNPLRKRFWFLLILFVILGILASVTIPKSPYYLYAHETPSKVIHVSTMQFAFLMSEKAIDPARPSGEAIELPVDELIEFRVTSMDVNHGFAIYNGEDRLITQTQAMPGYVNRLRYKFEEPGEYTVLCLEYCGMAHHGMRASFVVR